MKRTIDRKTIGGTMPSFADSPLLEFAKFTSKYTDAFQTRLVRIVCTIPVTSAQSGKVIQLS